MSLRFGDLQRQRRRPRLNEVTHLKEQLSTVNRHMKHFSFSKEHLLEKLILRQENYSSLFELPGGDSIWINHPVVKRTAPEFHTLFIHQNQSIHRYTYILAERVKCRWISYMMICIFILKFNMEGYEELKWSPTAYPPWFLDLFTNYIEATHNDSNRVHQLGRIA